MSEEQERLAGRVRQVLLDELATHCPQEREVGVFLSGGADSHSVLFALLAMGVRPTVFSIRREDRESRDFRTALRTARAFELTFIPVMLPVEQQQVLRDLQRVLRLGARKKADVECLWPRLRLLDAAKAHGDELVVTGDCADAHYVLSRKGMVHYKPRGISGLDEFRAMKFADPNYAQVAMIRTYAATLGIEVAVPWRSEAMQAVFRALPWETCNKPRQKELTRAAFSEAFGRVRVPPHQNLQLGDTGIADRCAELLDDPVVNVKGRKATAALYRDLAERWGVGRGDADLRGAGAEQDDEGESVVGRGTDGEAAG
jgi:asparagine synthetase B (glutamine-hydrolysing)